MAISAIDRQLWENFKGALSGPFTFTSVLPVQGGARVYNVQGGGNSFNISLRPHNVHVVGIDIVGYSKRSADAQFLLTALLFSRVDSAVRLLRQIGWMAASQPRLSIPLGDGGMFIFDDDQSLASSLAFVYCLNMFVEDLNRQYIYSATSTAFEAAQPYPVIPIHCRFSLNTGEIFFMEDVNGADNAVGEAIVRCARILAASKGAHFLVDSAVMGELGRQGGIDGVAHLGAPWAWDQSFHTAQMADIQVKSASLRFFNVFGKYGSGRLLAAQGGTGGTAYSIGSHDVASIRL